MAEAVWQRVDPSPEGNSPAHGRAAGQPATSRVFNLLANYICCQQRNHFHFPALIFSFYSESVNNTSVGDDEEQPDPESMAR